MRTLAKAVVGILATALVVPVWAQSVISAKSGLVHYVEGKVLISGKEVTIKPGSYVDIREKEVLQALEGRAEVLLTPGVFLRVAENTSLRMITNRLIDTRLELLTGSAVVEAAEVGKDTGVTIVCKDGAVALRKTGIYRFDAEPARLRVFAGEAHVSQGGRTVAVSSGKSVSLEGKLEIARFDKDDTDALMRWSRRRGELLAAANASAAKSLLDSGYRLYSSSWGWNSYLGMWTFLPARGFLSSPYGYRYWSPVTVGQVYYRPAPVYTGGGWNSGFPAQSGYASMPASSGGYSGSAVAAASAAPSHSSSSTSTAASSGGSTSVGHGGSSGGGGGRR